MKNLGLIIKREFLTRVRKKSFIVITILGPVFMAILLFLPAFLATLPGEDKVISVLDESVLMDFEKGTDEIKLRYLPPDQFNLEQAQEFSKAEGDYAFLYIPLSEGGDPDFVGRNVQLFCEGDVSLSVEGFIEDKLEEYIQKEKLKVLGVDPEIIAQTKTQVNIRIINTEAGIEAENTTLIKMGIGYVAAFAIYIFIFIYGSQIMRGVIEEKSNRIMELMVSSIKPFELMMGKILGIGLLALLQFVIWIGLGAVLYAAATAVFIAPSLEAGELMQGANMAVPEMANTPVFEIWKSLQGIDFLSLAFSFLFYFIGGYLLYGSFFAAVGSAVDKESDSQQMILPVTIPLILSLLVLLRALDSPDSGLAFWFSMVPLSSPIVMMARLPFGVPLWELFLSMGLLALCFFGGVWVAAKIYRVGILMYGKKPTFKELYRWTRYKN